MAFDQLTERTEVLTELWNDIASAYEAGFTPRVIFSVYGRWDHGSAIRAETWNASTPCFDLTMFGVCVGRREGRPRPHGVR
jgi:hypothetical protein